MGWLSDLLRGAHDELAWDDLVRRSADEIMQLKRHGARGEIVFPADVSVRITVGEGSVATVQEMVDRASLDREVGALIANRCDVPLEQLPQRQYVVSAANRTTITAVEGTPQRWQFVVEGGDRSGATLSLPDGWTEVAFGRGEWHGDDRGARNDLVIAERTAFVSRRAGRLFRSGHVVEVSAIDQGDQLIVRRAGGDVVRPARTASGKVAVRIGDSIDLVDGRDGLVRMHLQRVER